MSLSRRGNVYVHMNPVSVLFYSAITVDKATTKSFDFYLKTFFFLENSVPSLSLSQIYFSTGCLAHIWVYITELFSSFLTFDENIFTLLFQSSFAFPVFFAHSHPIESSHCVDDDDVSLDSKMRGWSELWKSFRFLPSWDFIMIFSSF